MEYLNIENSFQLRVSDSIYSYDKFSSDLLGSNFCFKFILPNNFKTNSNDDFIIKY